MRIWIGYGYHPNTTGYYLEQSLRRQHEVFYVGTPHGVRTGFSSWIDLTELANDENKASGLFLYVDVSNVRYFPRGMECLKIPTACYLIDVHRDLRWRLPWARFFDFVFVAQKSYVDVFRQALGHNQVYWLPLACDPDVHQDLGVQRIYDVGFVGAVGPRHPRRTKIVESLAQKYRLNDYHRYYSPSEMAQVYSQSKIVVNVPIGNDLNMRVFEALSCGALLITEQATDGQEELFQSGKHLVTFSHEEEVVDLVDYYLSHELEREQIAHQGRVLAQEHHTYDHRARTIIDTVTAGRSDFTVAPMRLADAHERILAYEELYSRLMLIDALFEQFENGIKSNPCDWRVYSLGAKGILRRVRSALHCTRRTGEG